jgi:hypothetical protein
MSIIRQGFESADLDVPVVLPTLNLDFANSQSLDSRITFSRGSIGTRVNKNGLIETIAANQPRFDFDPISGECRGLLIEESRTNLLTGSDYSTNNSAGNSTLTLNATTAPDGTNSAVSFNGNAGRANKSFLKQYNTTTIGTYTASVFAKYNGEQFVVIRINDGSNNGARQVVNILNGTLSGSVSNDGTSTGASSSIVTYLNGWYKLSITVTFNSAITGLQNAIWLTNFGSTTTTNGVYMWGPQLEAGAFPTSYIPTTASTVTRSADRASMEGTNFSSWYNQSEGSIVTTYQKNSSFSYNFGVFSLTSSLSNRLNVIDFFPSSFTIYYNGNPQVYEFGGPFNITTKTKSAFSFATNKFFKCTDGTFYLSNMAGTGVVINSGNLTSGIKIPTVNTLVLGPYWGGVQPLNGTIKKLAYYPKALSPAELQYLTQ